MPVRTSRSPGRAVPATREAVIKIMKAVADFQHPIPGHQPGKNQSRGTFSTSVTSASKRRPVPNGNGTVSPRPLKRILTFPTQRIWLRTIEYIEHSRPGGSSTNARGCGLTVPHRITHKKMAETSQNSQGPENFLRGRSAERIIPTQAYRAPPQCRFVVHPSMTDHRAPNDRCSPHTRQHGRSERGDCRRSCGQMLFGTATMSGGNPLGIQRPGTVHQIAGHFPIAGYGIHTL